MTVVPTPPVALCGVLVIPEVVAVVSFLIIIFSGSTEDVDVLKNLTVGGIDAKVADHLVILEELLIAQTPADAADR